MLPAVTSKERHSPRPSVDEHDLMNNAVHQPIENLIPRVRGEYLEMPGLCLTDAQAGRLWGLDTTTCQRLLRALVDAQFLTHSPDGRYRLRSSDPERNGGLVTPTRASNHRIGRTA